MMFTLKSAAPRAKPASKLSTWRSKLSFAGLSILAEKVGIKRPKPAASKATPAASTHPWARALSESSASAAASRPLATPSARPAPHATPARVADGRAVARAVASAVAADRKRCEAIIRAGIEAGQLAVAMTYAFDTDMGAQIATENLSILHQDRGPGGSLMARMRGLEVGRAGAVATKPAAAVDPQAVAAEMLALAERVNAAQPGRQPINASRVQVVNVRPGSGSSPTAPAAE